MCVHIFRSKKIFLSYRNGKEIEYPLKHFYMNICKIEVCILISDVFTKL